jgi:hypothetical protein
MWRKMMKSSEPMSRDGVTQFLPETVLDLLANKPATNLTRIRQELRRWFAIVSAMPLDSGTRKHLQNWLKDADQLLTQSEFGTALYELRIVSRKLRTLRIDDFCARHAQSGTRRFIRAAANDVLQHNCPQFAAAPSMQ